MAVANPLYPAFNAGEVSPKMVARTDFTRYPHGVEILENMIPLPQGGALRRSGTRFVAAVKSESKKTALIPFEFSVTQAYILEAGDLYMRFYRNQGQIVTLGTDGVVTTTWTDDSNGTGSVTAGSGSSIDIKGSGGAGTGIATQAITTSNVNTPHVIKFKLDAIAGNKVTFRVGTTSGGTDIVDNQVFRVGFHCFEFTPTASPFYLQFRVGENYTVNLDNVSFISDAPVEIETPYTEDQVAKVAGPQSADVLYLFHPSHPAYKLLRLGNSSWSLQEVEWLDGPYGDTNLDTALTLKPSAATGNGITITASGHSPFSANDVGRSIRISNPASGTDWGYAVIVTVTAGHQVTADVKSAFATANASATWALGAWTTDLGYPAVATFFQQRLVTAATTDQPQTFWMSQTADFENMTPDNRDGTNDGTVEDDDALTWTISSDQVNVIRWMMGLKSLIIGTVGGEWIVRSSDQSIVVTPSDISVEQETGHGSANVQPVRVGNAILFLQRARRKVREFGFNFTDDGFRAIDLTRLADHITKPGINKLIHVQEPHSQVLCLRDDGQIAVLVDLRDEEVIGWSRYILGGTFQLGNAVVESAASIPGNSTTNSEDRNEAWLIVKRTIEGITRRYVEFLEFDFETGDTQEDAFYVDSGLTYDGSAITTITGLDHLDNETVAVWADGSVQPSRTVANGQVTLQDSAAKAQIGLPYTHKLKSLKIEAGGVAGTAVHKKKRIHSLGFTILNGMSMKFGHSDTTLKPKDFRKVKDKMDTAPPLFTGESLVTFEDSWDSDSRIIVTESIPAPFGLLALAPELRTHDTK